MAITREWQDHAEQNMNEPRGQILTGEDDWSVSTTGEFTGDYNYSGYGQKDGIGYAWETPLVDIRGNFIFSYEWVYGDTTLFHTVVVNQLDPGIEVRLMEDEWMLNLYIDGVLEESVSLFPYPQLVRNLHFASLGFFIEGGAYFVFTVDGQEIFDYNDINVPSTTDAVFICSTKNAGGVGWYPSAHLDDLYIDNAYGESFAIPPTYAFLMSLVNGDGIFQDWAAKGGGNDYLAVDDPASPDDDSTHIWSGIAGDVERFDTVNIVLPVGFNISAAIPWWVGRRGEADKTSAQIRSIVYDGSTDTGSDQVLPMWYTEMYDRHPLDPSSNVWTEGNFNSAEFGFETRGTI